MRPMAALNGHGYPDLRADFYCTLHVSLEHRYPQAFYGSKKLVRGISAMTGPQLGKNVLSGRRWRVAGRILLRHAARQAGHLDSIIRVQEQGQ